MNSLFKIIIVFFLILHFAGLFFVMTHSKKDVRDFIVALPVKFNFCPAPFQEFPLDSLISGMVSSEAKQDAFLPVPDITPLSPSIHNTHSDVSIVSTIIPELSFRILTPFSGDLFIFDPRFSAEKQRVQFQSTHESEWFVDNLSLGTGTSIFWPMTPGSHVVRAVYGHQTRVVNFFVK
ncbi:hypothetical protein COY07_04585 [Candidatus Peregrinibacteria bacterium CG_4_10_14_0_2_um_filter_43_11]|nr:MAG: hypothetical protein COY07_04585 [Candidatus Peregrinibacteria bacterium CG_4_10_14_0_2_um_filter_43_11]